MGKEKRSWGSDNSSVVENPKTQDYLLPSYKSMTEDSNALTMTTKTKTKTKTTKTKTKTSTSTPTNYNHKEESGGGNKALMYTGIALFVILLIIVLSLIYNKKKRAQQRIEKDKLDAAEGKLGVNDYSSNPNYNTVRPQNLNTIKPSGPLYSGPVYDPNKEHDYSTMNNNTNLGVATSVEAATLLRKQEQQEAAKLTKTNTLPNFNSDEQDSADVPPVPQTTSMYNNGYLNIYGQQSGGYNQYGSTYGNDYSYNQSYDNGNTSQYSYNQSYDANVSVSNETYEVDRDYVAIYSYEPAMSDELAINVNDRIHLLEMYSDGWGYGKNVTTGQLGVLPLNRLKIEEQPHSTGGYLDPLYQYRKNAEAFNDIQKRTVSMNRRPKKRYDDDRRRNDRRRYDDDDDYERRRDVKNDE
ncbi:hypothetical protein BCR32DRAFT_289769 [Anaeromyces robustus]|jgi:hypothetical protein|uniref:SH3 domain-containing protein n=1 Tax=Anaeromyces robustus TaxID=1754192 RepID=A0A1Y1XMU8_9FUNG|nr:hypothetical protein BCR32DRAFT_289769 [Anaeromyces robustus]|eukprot:ORX86836.1 hypothetical protein BCR32DRAFT_289769 [Anaeromyces robustus]